MSSSIFAHMDDGEEPIIPKSPDRRRLLDFVALAADMHSRTSISKKREAVSCDCLEAAEKPMMLLRRDPEGGLQLALGSVGVTDRAFVTGGDGEGSSCSIRRGRGEDGF